MEHTFSDGLITQGYETIMLSRAECLHYTSRGHVGWESLLPGKPPAAASQTGGKLSPAVFEQGEWRR